jgi:hypothetical protein
MTRPRSIRGDHLRTALAQEAARIMAEQGIADYGFAKRKAAERLGAGEFAVLPKNTEIDAALAQYQRLFEGDKHTATLTEQRQTACAVMTLLQTFNPRLTGTVLTGSATRYQPLELHCFSDSIEPIIFLLLEQRIAYKVSEHRIRFQADQYTPIPVLQFEFNGFAVEVLVFTSQGIRQAPLSPLDGRPQRRATLAEVQLLVQSSDEESRSLDAPWALNQ